MWAKSNHLVAQNPAETDLLRKYHVHTMALKGLCYLGCLYLNSMTSDPVGHSALATLASLFLKQQACSHLRAFALTVSSSWSILP